MTWACLQHLRVIYELKFERLKNAENKPLIDAEVYAKITSKSQKGEGESPHSELLKDTNFTYCQDKGDPLKQWNPSQYALIRNVVLRSKRMWHPYEDFLQKFMDAEIPNSLVEKMAIELNAIRKNCDTKMIRKLSVEDTLVLQTVSPSLLLDMYSIFS